jgi:dolichol-phosphate mannosyltransferase
MLSLAGQGITSFSIVPLRIATAFGLGLSIVSFLYAVYALFQKLVFGTALVGWASVLVSVLFLGGVQLIFLGILGEYLGKMFIETKNRPTYVISEKKL